MTTSKKRRKRRDEHEELVRSRDGQFVLFRIVLAIANLALNLWRVWIGKL